MKHTCTWHRPIKFFLTTFEHFSLWTLSVETCKKGKGWIYVRTFNASNVPSAAPLLKLLHKRAKSTHHITLVNHITTLYMYPVLCGFEWALSISTKNPRTSFGVQDLHILVYLLIAQKSSAPNKSPQSGYFTFYFLWIFWLHKNLLFQIKVHKAATLLFSFFKFVDCTKIFCSK